MQLIKHIHGFTFEIGIQKMKENIKASVKHQNTDQRIYYSHTSNLHTIDIETNAARVRRRALKYFERTTAPRTEVQTWALTSGNRIQHRFTQKPFDQAIQAIPWNPFK